jgi:cephalosporin-C deacetylase
MPGIDWPLAQLQAYKPALNAPADFDQFWAGTLAESAAQPLAATFTAYDFPSSKFEVFAVRYGGFGGGQIAGWLVKPKGAGKFPGLVVYHGYSGRGTRPTDLLAYAAQGMVVMSMDTRGQNGLSQNHAPHSSGAHAGWMTMGIDQPSMYYYRYAYADATRALEVMAARPDVDAGRIAVTGISQGGGLSLAAAALSPRPILALPDIPFLCDFRRAIEITPAGPYPEIIGYLKAQPYHTEPALASLAYCDNLNLAPRIKCRTVISNCLWDDICPPSTIFAAYNHISADKQMHIYPYHKHEVPYEHTEVRLRELARAFGL